ncbi:MAG: hypothetical protein ACFFBP_21735 [Promethearchaeota archaeon]
MSLGPVDYVNGITSIIYFIVSIIIAFIIMSKYFKYKTTSFLFVGFSTIGLVWPYLATIVSFLMMVFTLNPLPDSAYYIIGNILLPITTSTWIYAVIKLSHEGKEKIIVPIVFIFMVLLAIIYTILVFSRPDLIGEKLGIIDVKYIGFGLFYLIIALSFVWIGLIILLKDLIHSSAPDLKLKGIFLLFGLLTYTVASIFDGFLNLEIPFLLLMRILLMISSFEMYIGWLLPKSVKKLFLRK